MKLTGYVNSTDDFLQQPQVINGASDLISDVFENTGKHTRAVIVLILYHWVLRLKLMRYLRCKY